MNYINLNPQFLKALEKCTLEIPRTLEEKVTPEHTAVVVIDVQNDFCHNDGVQSKRGMDTRLVQEMIPHLSEFLTEARKYHALVIFVRTICTEWSISPVAVERLMKFPEHLRFFPLEGTWGAEFYQVSPQDCDCVVTKYRYSSFHGTSLELILKSRGIRTLIITGVATPVCVESTARDGYMKEFFVTLPKDCIAGRSLEEHNAALSITDKFFGQVVASQEIVSTWQNRTQHHSIRPEK